MKHSLSLITLLLFVSSVDAAWVEIPDNSDRALFQFNNIDNGTIELSFSLDGYRLELVEEGGERYQQISYPGEGELIETGKPQLPHFTRLLSIPDRGSVTIAVNTLEDERLSGMQIYPSRELLSESQPNRSCFTLDESFHNGSTPFPIEVVELGEPAIMRDLRVVTVTVYPFQYDPENRDLRVISNLELTISINGAGGANIKESSQLPSRFFQNTYRSGILNQAATENRTEGFQQPCYLFISRNNEDVLSSLEPLLSWKRQKGFEVHLATTDETGNSALDIKEYIQDAYDNWTNPPEFICLVGDAEGNYSIPTRYLDGGEGDHFYVRLDGDDILADAFVGRLSFDSINELDAIVFKILNYEKDPWTGQTDWYDRALMVGDPGSSGSSVVDTKRQVAAMIQTGAPNIECEEVYSGSWVYHMSSNINSGVSYFNYRGFYGMSGWNNNHIEQLENGFMLPVAVFLTCDVGSFGSSWGEARSEVFLRASQSPTVPRGAIAAIATATSQTHTCFNNCVDMGIFGGIFVDNIYHLGGALNSGKLNLYLSYPQNPANAVHQFSYWNNLMGDPGLEIWTGVPQELLVFHDSILPVGSNYLEVQVTDDSGTPLPDAWVTLSRDDELFFTTGLTDSEGEVVLDIGVTGEMIGDADLTVTLHDFRPYLGSVTVEQSDLFLGISGSMVDDDNEGDSAGNDDGFINPGEEIELALELYNHGTTPAGEVTALLSAASDLVTITDDTEVYGDIQPSEAGSPEDDFNLIIAPDVTGGQEIRCDLDIRVDGNHHRHDIYYFYVAAPNLYPLDSEVLDGDGILDPGETVQLVVQLFNGGTVDAPDVSGTLVSHNPRLAVEDPDGSFGTVTAGGSADNEGDTFTLRASSLILPGTQTQLELQITTPAGYDQSVNLMLEIGQVTVTDPLGPDMYGYVCYDDGDSGYQYVPVYNWVEIDPEYGGAGEELNLYDWGDTGAVDYIDLEQYPFSFSFYGEEYDLLSVSSNGWISPGYTANTSFMNWYIPGPGGPSPMIAPFWDDLRSTSGSVCYFYDEIEHCLIIEWSHLRSDYNNSEETFQALLYDRLYHPISTGDSRILFQYKTIDNGDIGSYGGGYVSHGQYATVGIEDHTSSVGLEYTFNNSYPAAARPLEDEMAILFTGYPLLHENPYLVLGEISVTDSGENGLIDYGEQVELEIMLRNLGLEAANGIEADLIIEDPYITLTGSYSIYDDIPSEGSGGNLSPFIFEVSPDLPNNHPIECRLLVTIPEESWELIFTLHGFAPVVEHSSMIVDDGENGVLNPGETADVLIAFHNEGGAAACNAALTISSEDEYLTINNGEWEFERLLAGETSSAVCNFTVSPDTPQNHIIVMQWELSGDLGYSAAGEFTLAVAQVTVWLEQNFDDWLTDGWTVVSSSGLLNWFHSATEVAGGEMPEARYAWIYQTDAVQRLISPPFSTLGHQDLELEFRHAINHADGPIGIRLETSSDGNNWQTAHSWPAADLEPTLEQLVISNSDVGSESFQLSWVVDGDSYNLSDWYIDNVRLGSQGYGFLTGTVTLLDGDGVIEDVRIAAGDLFTHPDSEGDYILLLPVGSYDVSASLENYAAETVSDVTVEMNQPVEIDFELQLGEGIGPEQLPFTTRLLDNYPNPFNPTTTIPFELAEPAADARVEIYNVRGQLVESLLQYSLQPGSHQVVWDSEGDNGRSAASGIYFFQLQVEGKVTDTGRGLLIK